MADMVQIPISSRTLESTNRRLVKSCQVASLPKYTLKKTFDHVKNLVLENEPSGRLVLFLVKVAALEIVRRVSRKNCPAVWHVLQAMQVLTCPPLKWIQKWAPIRNLIKGMKVISRPLLFVSVTTAFSNHSQSSTHISKNADDSQQQQQCSDSHTSHTNSCKRVSDEASESIVSDKKDDWLLQLRKELEKQGMVLPERINNDELRRFHIAANGDFSCLLQSIKKTIHWRENYQFLSAADLEMWSHLVFWHGSDAKHRPCLIIHLGLACSRVVPQERSHFTQAIVSQIENGVLYLVNGDDPKITVLMDCEGLSPLRFPTKMLKSCSSLMQDHYPNQLAALLAIRLPPVTRVIARTFIQVLKPTTREKLQIVGENYQKVLAEFFQSVPSFLGGNCTCPRCHIPPTTKFQGQVHEACKHESHGKPLDKEYSEAAYCTDYLPLDGSCILRTGIIGVLVMFWIFVALAHRGT